MCVCMYVACYQKHSYSLQVKEMQENVKEKLPPRCEIGKEVFIQKYLNKGVRLNLNLLKQKGNFLNTGVGHWSLAGGCWRGGWSAGLDHLCLQTGTDLGQN